MISPFLILPPKTPNPIFHFPAYNLCPPLSWPGIPLHWSIKPSQDQWPLLSLISEKAILCYIFLWSHGSLHVYSLIGSLVPGSSGGYKLVYIITVPPMGLQTSSVPWVLSLVPPIETLCSVYWLAVSHGYFDTPSMKNQSIYTLIFPCPWAYCGLRIVFWVFWASGLIATSQQSIPCVVSCDWVTSLRVLFSSFIHLPKDFMNSLFLIVE